MVTDTRERIVEFITKNKQARVHDLVLNLKIGNVAIHRQLNKLISTGILRKIGKPPLVMYVLDKEEVTAITMIPKEIQDHIDTDYLYVSPEGRLVYGFKGFVEWVKKIHEEKRLLQLSKEYLQTIKTANKNTGSQGWINATEKIKDTFKNNSSLDKLLYGDFYSLPKFGKTKLGQLVLYAKQSQNKQLMEEVAKIVRPLINKIIKEYKINAVAFVPPTVPRNIQFIDELAHLLRLKLPVIELVKVSGPVLIPQKTLSSLEERIINARDTIYTKYVAETSYPNVLLIDDAAGSGATLNEISTKLKSVMVGKNKIIGFVIVGSIKGFDVIREV